MYLNENYYHYGQDGYNYPEQDQRLFGQWGSFLGGLMGFQQPQQQQWSPWQQPTQPWWPHQHHHHGGYWGPPGPPPGPPPGHGQSPWGPPGPPPGTGHHDGPPTSPPPAFTPTKSQQVGVMAVDPGAIRGCLYRYTYIWLTNRQQFWFYPTFVGRRSISGYRWDGFRWVYFGTDLRSIESFQCM